MPVDASEIVFTVIRYIGIEILTAVVAEKPKNLATTALVKT